MQARSMSQEVDTVALAALARSNARAICVSHTATAAEQLTQHNHVPAW